MDSIVGNSVLSTIEKTTSPLFTSKEDYQKKPEQNISWVTEEIAFELVYENDKFQHLGSVVTNNGYSDWATTEIPASIKSMWYRLSRRCDDFCIECSYDGIIFKQMRVCHMFNVKETIKFGIYACSPEDSSFKAIFTNMLITECKWQAHDGQQPDTFHNLRRHSLLIILEHSRTLPPEGTRQKGLVP